MVNSRPLCVARDGRDDMTPVCPSELTVGKKLYLLPDGNSTKGNIVKPSPFVTQLRRRRQLLLQYWRLWSQDFLAAQAPERRWRSADCKALPGIKVGQVVLIRDPKMGRGDWKIARVHEVIAGSDGICRQAVLLLPRVEGKPQQFLRRSARLLALLEGQVDEDNDAV